MKSKPRLGSNLSLFALLAIAALSSGCSISKAISQPDKKDMSVLMPGNPRVEVIAELGQPSHQESVNGYQRDVYAFHQGYTKPVKAARAIGHGFALISTLGLWELAGYPLECVFDGEEVQVAVDYDPSMTITDVTYFKGGHLRGNGPTLPPDLYGASVKGDADVVHITRNADGQTIVQYGVKPPAHAADETRVGAAPASHESPPTREEFDQEIRAATYYSSSDRSPVIQAGGAKLR